MIDKKLKIVLDNAFHHSKKFNHEMITTDHLVCFLLWDEDIIELVTKLGADSQFLQNELGDFLSQYDSTESFGMPNQSLAVSEVMDRAIQNSQVIGRSLLGPIDLFYTILNSEIDSYSISLLNANNVSAKSVNDFVKEETNNTVNNAVEKLKSMRGQKENSEEFLIDLNTKFKDDTDPIIGRNEELDRMLQILSRKKKSNPILVGEAGVGKTSVVEGLVKKILAGEVPEKLKNVEVFELNISSMLSGTKYRGDFEKKFEKMLKELEKIEHPILFIDEIHTITNTGESNSGSNLSEMLKPYLTTSRFKVIGTTTYTDYKKSFQSNDALSRRFSKVDIKEPNLTETVTILEGIKDSYEKHHNVVYTDEVIQNIVNKSHKYLHDRFLPDSAIDLMDEIGSKVSLKKGRKSTITVKDVDNTIGEMSNLPSETMEKNDITALKTLDKSLKEEIFGQDEVIDLLTETIFMNKAGISDDNKPIASFLFAGPTGVGKTEVSKQLASKLGISYFKLDMSEYMDKVNVSKLIGAAPGYVGYEEGGVLVEYVKKNPHSVIVFDEIEKAHPDISNILLQILDEGTLTDNTGYKANLKNCIIVLTSNLGTKNKNSLNFEIGGNKPEISKKTGDAIKNYFAPEIRNRIDNIVEFNHLNIEDVVHIVDKNLVKLNSQLVKKNVNVSITEEAKTFIAESGYDQTLGARPIDREFVELVKKPITKELLFGEINKGGEIFISLNKSRELSFDYKVKSETKKTPAKKTRTKKTVSKKDKE